jgi:ABC-type multidrug transport system ATPase subunit
MLEAELVKKRDSFILDAKITIAGNGCILGRNGSGKSTLLNLIAGFLRPDKGIIKLNGIDITDYRVEDRKVVLITPSSYIPNLDVDEHLLWAVNKEREYLLNDVKLRLGVNFSGIVDKLSSGMKVRIAIATALLSDVKLLLVDEAFSFIDYKDKFINVVAKMTKELDKQLIFATQDESDSTFADEAYLLKDGKANKIK